MKLIRRRLVLNLSTGAAGKGELELFQRIPPPKALNMSICKLELSWIHFLKIVTNVQNAK